MKDEDDMQENHLNIKVEGKTKEDNQIKIEEDENDVNEKDSNGKPGEVKEEIRDDDQRYEVRKEINIKKEGKDIKKKNGCGCPCLII